MLSGPLRPADARLKPLRRRLMATALILLALLTAWAWTPDLPPETLAARYLRAPADRVPVLDTVLHVRDDGPRDAPAVLMLHGFGASLHTWEPWVEEWKGPLRLIRVDLPGHGLSGADPSGDYTDARSLRLLLGLLDGLGLQQVDVVGHSMGGRIAWTLAARHPERVRRLVLVAPDGFASPPVFEYGKVPEVPAVLQLMRVVLPRAVLKMNLAPAYADPSALTDERVDRYHDLLRAPGARQAMLDRMRQTVLDDPVPRLRSIRAPTLLVWGEEDRMIPLTNAQDYVQALPASRLLRLPGVGHLPHEEAPERAGPAVKAFLLER
jgi:pimeloyl-ACP methyl ester carboxylesterase